MYNSVVCVQALNGHDSLVSCLLRHGADVTLVDDAGLTPADVAKTKRVRTTLRQAWVAATQPRVEPTAAAATDTTTATASDTTTSTTTTITTTTTMATATTTATAMTTAKPAEVSPPVKRKKGEVIFDVSSFIYFAVFIFDENNLTLMA